MPATVTTDTPDQGLATTDASETNTAAAVEEDLRHMTALLEVGDIAGVRRYLSELEARWPDSERVRYYARVLAPPTVMPGRPARPRPTREQERTWLREHAREYPGQWLALFGDQLLAADPSLGVVLKVLDHLPNGKDALLHLVMGKQS